MEAGTGEEIMVFVQLQTKMMDQDASKMMLYIRGPVRFKVSF